ncbi:MAG: hypothetical protein KAS07_03080 [Candidatus Pacebacteria bacterium]|nr:hypothetical protein [Candidatus Paceibacterota bacterium]
MFISKKIREQIESILDSLGGLRDEVFKEEVGGFFFVPRRRTLLGRVKDNNVEIKELRQRIEMLEKHLKLEYRPEETKKTKAEYKKKKK